MKNLLLFSLLLYFSFPVLGQERIGFAYDSAGNRVKREVVLSRSMSADVSDDNGRNSFFDTLGEKNVKLTGTSGWILKIEILGYESDDDACVEVFSLDSIRILSRPVKDATDKIDISGHIAGIYILKVPVNGRQTSWKIAKR